MKKTMIQKLKKLDTRGQLSSSDDEASDEILDKEFEHQLHILRDISMLQTNQKDILLCVKWLNIFSKTSKEEKVARNCLMSLLYTQLNENGELGRPFRDLQNCNRELTAVLNDYKAELLKQNKLIERQQKLEFGKCLNECIKAERKRKMQNELNNKKEEQKQYNAWQKQLNDAKSQRFQAKHPSRGQKKSEPECIQPEDSHFSSQLPLLMEAKVEAYRNFKEQRNVALESLDERVEQQESAIINNIEHAKFRKDTMMETLRQILLEKEKIKQAKYAKTELEKQLSLNLEKHTEKSDPKNLKQFDEPKLSNLRTCNETFYPTTTKQQTYTEQKPSNSNGEYLVKDVRKPQDPSTPNSVNAYQVSATPETSHSNNTRNRKKRKLKPPVDLDTDLAASNTSKKQLPENCVGESFVPLKQKQHVVDIINTMEALQKQLIMEKAQRKAMSQKTGTSFKQSLKMTESQSKVEQKVQKTQQPQQLTQPESAKKPLKQPPRKYQRQNKVQTQTQKSQTHSELHKKKSQQQQNIPLDTKTKLSLRPAVLKRPDTNTASSSSHHPVSKAFPHKLNQRLPPSPPVPNPSAAILTQENCENGNGNESIYHAGCNGEHLEALRTQNLNLRRELDDMRLRAKSVHLENMHSNTRLVRRNYHENQFKKYIESLKKKLMESAENIVADMEKHVEKIQQELTQSHRKSETQETLDTQNGTTDSVGSKQKEQSQSQTQTKSRSFTHSKKTHSKRPSPHGTSPPKSPFSPPRVLYNSARLIKSRQLPHKLGKPPKASIKADTHLEKNSSDNDMTSLPRGIFRMLYATLLEDTNWIPVDIKPERTYIQPWSIQLHYDIAVIDARLDAALNKRFEKFFDARKNALASQLSQMYEKIRQELSLKFTRALRTNARHAHLKRRYARAQCFSILRSIFHEIYDTKDTEMWHILAEVEEKYNNVAR